MDRLANFLFIEIGKKIQIRRRFRFIIGCRFAGTQSRPRAEGKLSQQVNPDNRLFHDDDPLTQVNRNSRVTNSIANLRMSQEFGQPFGFPSAGEVGNVVPLSPPESSRRVFVPELVNPILQPVGSVENGMSTRDWRSSQKKLPNPSHRE